MDYIPLPSHAREPHLKVPFLARLQYDGLGLADFPQRHGITDDDLTNADPEELAAILQAWLYFGLMSVFTGILLKNEEFRRPADPEGQVGVDPQPFTCILQQASQYDRIRLPVVEHETQQMDTPPCLCHQLRLAWVCLEKFECRNTPSSSTASIVFLSIRVLINSLFLRIHPSSGRFLNKDTSSDHWRPELRRIFNPYSPPEHQRSAAVQTLTAEMEAAGLCPFTSRHLCETHDWTTTYYLSRIQYGSFSHHSNCSTNECVANNVDETTYETKHTSNACTCPLASVLQDKVKDIILRKRIPLIRMVGNTRGLIDLSVEEASPNSTYIALSHVWIDGLGNRKGNSIHHCQLQRIKRLLDASPEAGLQHSFVGAVRERIMKSESSQGFVPAFEQGTTHQPKKDYLFWLDTLCVPLSKVELRQLAIDHMDAVYAAAQQEALAKFICSAWMSRSWTLQEGVLASDRRVVFADGFYDPTVAPPANLKAPWSVPQRLPFTADYIRDTHEISWGNADTNGKYNLHRTISNQSSGNLEFLSKSIGFALHQQICTTFGSPHSRSVLNEPFFSNKEKNSDRLVHVWNALSWRSTTKKEDLLVLVANLLFLRASDLVKFTPITEKVRAILWGLPTIPISILFNTGPRLKPGDDHDDRWLPTEIASSQLFEESDFLACSHLEATFGARRKPPQDEQHQSSEPKTSHVRVNGSNLAIETCDLIAISFKDLALGSNTFILHVEGSVRFQVTLHRGLTDEIALSRQIMSVIILPHGTMQSLQADHGDIHEALLHMTRFSELRFQPSDRSRSNVLDTKYDCPLIMSNPAEARGDIASAVGETGHQLAEISGFIISEATPTVNIATGTPKDFISLGHRPEPVDLSDPQEAFFILHALLFFPILVILVYLMIKAPFSRLNIGARATGILACLYGWITVGQELLVTIFCVELHRSKGGFEGAEYALVLTIAVLKAAQFAFSILHFSLFIHASSRYERQRWLKSFDVEWDLTLWQSIWIFVFDEVEAGRSSIDGFFSLLPKLISMVLQRRQTLLD